MKKKKLTLSQIRKISLLIVGIFLLFFTVGYATLNANLMLAGEVDIKYKRTDVYISGINNETFSDGGEEREIPIYYDAEAHFQVNTPKATSTIEYDIVIQNDSSEIKSLQKVETLLNSNDLNVIYEISGFNIGDIIGPGESKTSHIKVYVKEGAVLENPITLLNILFKFETVNWIPLEVEFLSETDYGDLSTNKDGVTFEFRVTNPNPVKTNYYITSNNARFTITDAITGKIGYELGPNQTITHTVRITLREDVTYENLLEEINLILKTTYPPSEDIIIHKVSLNLPRNFKSVILNSMPISESPESFTSIEATNGYLLRTNEIDELSYTYFYRGVVENNYVQFAGHLWRIVRIDSNGNLRVVLNNSVDTKSKYNSNYSSNHVESFEDSMNLIDYRNSDVRKAVEAWYNSNIVPNEESKYVVNSNFCIDMSYQGPIETKDEHTVYYFTPYIHVGRDFDNHTPDFTCSTENIFTSPVGLLTAEEVFAAGGYWETINDKYYLYNQELSNQAPSDQEQSNVRSSWTMSGSYYSLSEKQAGVIVFNSDLGLFDWVRGGNLTENYGYRPVISLNGNIKVVGNGTKENPFQLID